MLGKWFYKLLTKEIERQNQQKLPPPGLTSTANEIRPSWQDIHDINDRLDAICRHLKINVHQTYNKYQVDDMSKISGIGGQTTSPMGLG
jgi:hypothetical protein